jgi:hypothetical protein
MQLTVPKPNDRCSSNSAQVALIILLRNLSVLFWIVVISSAMQEENEFSEIFGFSFWWKYASLALCDLCITNYGKPCIIDAALKILDVIRTTKTSLYVSSESGVHMITGPDYVMTPHQLQILLIFKGQDMKMFTFPEL